MQWNKTSSIKPADGGKIRIKTQHGELGLTDIERNNVGQVVALSRSILPRVMAQIAWPQTGTKEARNARMTRYFLTAANGPSNDELSTIYKKLELVMNGINAKINVKVANDDDAYGYVGFRTGAQGVLRGVFSPRHNIGRRNGGLVSRGDIHLDQATLDNENLMAITFIHEASHKYASTADHGNSGYLKNDGVTFRAPGLTKVQALNNADSYAWFCFAEYNGL